MVHVLRAVLMSFACISFVVRTCLWISPGFGCGGVGKCARVRAKLHVCACEGWAQLLGLSLCFPNS